MRAYIDTCWFRNTKQEVPAFTRVSGEKWNQIRVVVRLQSFDEDVEVSQRFEPQKTQQSLGAFSFVFTAADVDELLSIDDAFLRENE